jgi:bifunctional enzyme CysN/CysC
MPVQGVYKFTQQNDDRRLVAGSIDTGKVRVGDEVVFYPSGKKSRVQSIEAFNRPRPMEAAAGQATGFTLTEQVYVARGELATVSGETRPSVSTRLRVSLFWLGRSPLVPRKEYWLKLGSARVPVKVDEIHRVLDASDLATSESPARVQRHEVAECTLALGRPLAFDVAQDLQATARFVIVDNYEISGGGIIRESVADSQSSARDRVMRRNLKWSAGGVAEERRAERLSQRAALLLITGERDVDRKRLGRDLETRLFDEGRFVYFLAIGNLLYGVDADLDRSHENRAEHIRRLSEVANILLDSGLIVVATAIGLTQYEVDLVSTAVGADRVSAVWVGDRVTTDLAPDLVLSEQDAAEEGVGRLKMLLQERGVIYRPW